MADNSIESDEDPRDYSLMREEEIDSGLDSNEAIKSLTKQVETVSQNVGALATLMSYISTSTSRENKANTGVNFGEGVKGLYDIYASYTFKRS